MRVVAPDDEPIDPDVDLGDPRQCAEARSQPLLLPAVAVGGAVGASLRHLLEVWWPPAAGQLPWATLATNLVGALVMGVLMVVVSSGPYEDRFPLLRPYVGVGVLGGFTTMSTWAVGTTVLGTGGHLGVAITYALVTVLGAVGAAALGRWLAHRVEPSGVTTRTVVADGAIRRVIGGAALGLAVPTIAMLVGAGTSTWWVVLGAVVGAPARYLVDRMVQSVHRTVWPWGTTMINLSGSLVLGILTGAGIAPTGMLLLGVGFCGSFTTWSSAAYEVTALWRQRHRPHAISYGLAVPAACAVLALAGLWAARTVVGT